VVAILQILGGVLFILGGAALAALPQLVELPPPGFGLLFGGLGAFLIVIGILALLVGCSTVSAPHVQRNGNLSPSADAGQAADVAADAARESQGAPQAVVRRGTGTMIIREAARAPAPALHGASTGEATFNFEGESLQAVVKAILGDMLGQSYTIAPGVQGTVTVATARPVGPALFEFYRRADIFVIASRSSFEGFPRVIWEAMAHNLPVVATRVGSIPLFLVHERDAILVPPHSPADLANAIARTIRDSGLRKLLIGSGMQLARMNTLEARAEELMSRIQDYLDHNAMG